MHNKHTQYTEYDVWFSVIILLVELFCLTLVIYKLEDAPVWYALTTLFVLIVGVFVQVARLIHLYIYGVG